MSLTFRNILTVQISFCSSRNYSSLNVKLNWTVLAVVPSKSRDHVLSRAVVCSNSITFLIGMWAQLVENGAAVCHSGSFVLQGCNPQRKCFSFISQFFEGAQSRLLIFEAQGYEMQSAAQWLPEDAVLMCSQLRKLWMVNCT